MFILKAAICAVVGYLLGSLNGGILISKARHDDIRSKGSGNAGFTNAMRSYGRKTAIVVCLIDMLKTIIACVIGRLLLPDMAVMGCFIAGIAVQLGHIIPLWFGFKGGKGFICSMSVVLVADWRIFLVSLGVLFAVTLLTKYVSLASMSASLTYVILFAVLYSLNLTVLIPAVIMFAVIVICHRENIARLLKGTENKTYFFKKKA